MAKTVGNKTFTLTLEADGYYRTRPPQDTTAPTLNGDITISNVTTSGFTASWPAATDTQSGVLSYDLQYANNSGFTSATTLTTAGTSVPIAGLAAGTWYVRYRARDNAATPNVTSYTSAQSTTISSGGGGTGTLIHGGGFEGFSVATLSSNQQIDATSPSPGESYRVSFSGSNNVAQIVSSPVISGSRAFRSYCIREGAVTKRSELRVRSPHDSWANPTSDSLWVGVSFRVLSWPAGLSDMTPCQWHHRGLTGNPPAAFFVNSSRLMSWSHRAQTTIGGSYTGYNTTPTVTLNVGQTYRAVMHIVWDYRSTGNGRCEVWVDGTKYVNYTGPIGYAGTVAGEEDLVPYLKIGGYLYAFGYSSSDGEEWEAIHDDLKIAGDDGTYELVA